MCPRACLTSQPGKTGGRSGALFSTGLWQSVHIDDLRRATVMVSNVTKLQNLTISQLFNADDRPEGESRGKIFGALGW